MSETSKKYHKLLEEDLVPFKSAEKVTQEELKEIIARATENGNLTKLMTSALQIGKSLDFATTLLAFQLAEKDLENNSYH